MKRPLTKVNRVKSVEEALELERLGVSYVGINIDGNAERKIFVDDRNLSMIAAREIAAQIKKAQVVFEFCCEELGLGHLQAADACDVRLVQFDCIHHFGEYPSAELMVAAQILGIRLILSGVQADYDYDPGWILSRYDDMNLASLELIEIQACTELNDGWSHIRYEAPSYPEGLHVEDIDDLASRHPIFLSFNITSENVIEICQSFHHVRGLSFTLGNIQPHLSCYYHDMDFESVYESLSELRTSVD